LSPNGDLDEGRMARGSGVAPRSAGSASEGRGTPIPVCDRTRESGTVQTSRAISSAGERFVHTEEATGSIPVSPTQNPRSEARLHDGDLAFMIV
jgi:hypothetical protein